MFSFRRRDNPHTLAVGMAGVKMGDRLLQIHCPDGGRMAALAAKVGLSGRAVVLAPGADAAARASKAAASAGVLVEVEVGPLPTLGFENGAFDLVVVDDTAGAFATAAPEPRVELVRELFRVLRPGGRVMIISQAPRGALEALLSRNPSAGKFAASPFLQADGFRSVRTLAEREGLTFVEGIKPRV